MTTAPVALHRNPDFRRLWTGQVASDLGTTSTQLVVPLLVLTTTTALAAFTVTLDTTTARTAGTGRDEHTAVFAATSADVVRVIADGKVVFEKGDTADIGRELDEAIGRLWT